MSDDLARVTAERDVRVMHCEVCGGDGGWDAERPGQVWMRCEACQGVGSYEVELKPVTEGDVSGLRWNDAAKQWEIIDPEASELEWARMSVCADLLCSPECHGAMEDAPIPPKCEWRCSGVAAHRIAVEREALAATAPGVGRG